MMVDYVRKMTMKKSCKYGGNGLFEHFLSLYFLLFCVFFFNAVKIGLLVLQMYSKKLYEAAAALYTASIAAFPLTAAYNNRAQCCEYIVYFVIVCPE